VLTKSRIVGDSLDFYASYILHLRTVHWKLHHSLESLLYNVTSRLKHEFLMQCNSISHVLYLMIELCFEEDQWICVSLVIFIDRSGFADRDCFLSFCAYVVACHVLRHDLSAANCHHTIRDAILTLESRHKVA